MPAFRSVIRTIAALGLVPAAFALPACHGSSSTTSSGPSALFAPDKPAPGPATLALLAGSSSGASVNVRVTVTGVTGFLGAAFEIKYDPTALLFNGMTDSASFLRTAGPAGASYSFVEDHTTTPGVIIVTATLLDPTVGLVNVTTTSDLVVLNFSARRAIVAATAEGRLDFDDSTPPTRRVEVCDTANPPTCTSTTVEWFGGGVSAQ